MTISLLKLINKIIELPLILPGSDIASVAKNKLIAHQQQSYVQLYSRGKLELMSYALIIALSLTYAKVTSVDRFWDILREYFRNIEPNQLYGRGELYHTFTMSQYELMIEKQ